MMRSARGARRLPIAFGLVGAWALLACCRSSSGNQPLMPVEVLDRAPDASAPDASVPTAPRAPTSLLLPQLWKPLTAAEDPFDDRPQVVECSDAAVMPEFLSEETVLGVDTGGCNYLTARQPIQRAVAVGEIIRVRIWHFQLTAAAPAEAHVALLVDGLPVMDARVPIPQAGGLVKSQVQVTRAIAAGAPAYFHLHNHGANNWALVEVTAGP